MRVGVHQRQMAVRVAMRLAGGIAGPVSMLVVRVVDMAVLVAERRVDMLVLVPFGKVEIEPDRHQRAGHRQPNGDCLAEHGDC